MNFGRQLNVRIHAELDALVALCILEAEQATSLKTRYPVTAVDYMALIRIFTVLGALTAMTGAVVIIREHLNWLLVSEVSLTLAGLGLIGVGHWLRGRKALPVFGETAQLVGCMALQGLSVVLATYHMPASENWPQLIGFDTLLLGILAYTLVSRYVLWYAGINFFFWFGAQTGYLAGWGCYWLGMTYPVRYLAVGAVTLLMAWLHALTIRGRWTEFSRVYMHYGMLVINLALWFLSLFGYYEDPNRSWDGTQGERLFYSLLWALVAGGSLFAGVRLGLRLLRGYGLTFLIINIYTFYFQFVVANTGEAWFLHLLLTGGSLLWLGVHLERKRQKPHEQA